MNSKKSPIIWKINLSRKVPIISGMRVKNCQKNVKIFFFHSSLPEVLLKNTVLESLVNRPAANSFVCEKLVMLVLFKVNFIKSLYPQTST